MSDISKEALDREIENLERQLAALRELRTLKYGGQTGSSTMPYANVKPWQAIVRYLRERGGEAEYEEIYRAMMSGGAAIAATSNPPWSFRKAIHQGVKAGHYLLNGKTMEGVEEAGPGDRISLKGETP